MNVDLGCEWWNDLFWHLFEEYKDETRFRKEHEEECAQDDVESEEYGEECAQDDMAPESDEKLLITAIAEATYFAKKYNETLREREMVGEV